MRHFITALSILLLCSAGVQAQLVIDNFNKGPLINWVPGSSKYVLSKSGDTMKVACSGVGLNFEGFGKSFSPINMSKHTKIKVKIRIPSGGPSPRVRMDVTDLTGFDSNRYPVSFIVTADGVWHEYTFNYAGKFEASYPSLYSLDPTRIVRVYLYVTLGGTPYTGDIYFDDFILDGAQEPAVIPASSEWKFLDDGTDPGSSWMDEAFDDSGWMSDTAELGYGDGDEKTIVSYGSSSANKYITTYFRKKFNFADTSVFKNIIMNLRADDGAAVYLNGNEVYRYNLPAGVINNNTLAQMEITSDETEKAWQRLVLTESILDSGENVIAAEVHQASASSDDLSFDLTLTGTEYATGLVRGPYLQSASDTSILIRWRTLQNTDSRVRYGSTSSNLSSVTDKNDYTTEHEILLTGLTPATKYYYSIGTTTDTLSGGDASHYFITSPVKGTDGPVRIWALGDAGKTTNEQRNVGSAYNTFKGSNHTDVWLLLGDNAYNEGTDEEYQLALFENMFEEPMKNTVLWPTPGNHDLRSYMSPGAVAPYYNIFSTPVNGESGGVPSGTEGYYSFDYGNIHFISLDSYGNNRDSTAGMATWLKADLAATTQRWIIAYWHHPPYSKGTNDSDGLSGEDIKMGEMRRMILPLLEKRGVDLVLNGHSHNYERSYLIHGHYGVSSTFADHAHYVNGKTSGHRSLGEEYYKNPVHGQMPDKGAVYTVVGCSGLKSSSVKWLTQTGNLITNALMYKSLNQYLGSMSVVVHKDTLTAKFIDDQGNVRDDFTIIKDNTRDITLVSGYMEDAADPNNLLNVFPNPASGNVLIRYGLTKSAKVEIEVFDEKGNKVEDIFSGKQYKGEHEFVLNFNGRDCGVYTVMLKADKNIYSRKVIRVK